jgi:cell division protein FtsQ
MNGGGRFARSRRPQQPQPDLRAALRGAGILLRAFASRIFGSTAAILMARRTRNRSTPEPSSNRVIAFVERHAPRQFGTIATMLLLGASLGLGVVRGDHLTEVSRLFDDARNAGANRVGFRIAAVDINGRSQLTQDEVLAIGGITGQSSLLFLDAATVRDRLKSNPWIADATVLKFYPGRLQIDISERKPFAVWQRDGRLSVIADDGAVLEAFVARRFANLPLVVGQGADTKARDFLALLDRYPQLRAQTKAAILVSERRWNLRLADGLDVRLPEFDAGTALATLARLDKEDRIFERDIEAVDLRLADRITVRLSEEAAKARDEQFKPKTPKRKANDA